MTRRRTAASDMRAFEKVQRRLAREAARAQRGVPGELVLSAIDKSTPKSEGDDMNNTTAYDPTIRNIAGAHCQACGSTKPAHVRDLRDTQGYTRCCNERVVSNGMTAYGTPERCSTNGSCYHE